ncbi:hypothetical protein C0Q70_02572 [Pomacea canaliculata]|uniref:BHLH domain-containing protein n=1 Tax=Pomacea canaliculata TaxID=400727 RepID=A0A2T7PQB0_POMCA|nr:hypothetical protein C0Q70_02572 [Pomacea canaliculata]
MDKKPPAQTGDNITKVSDSNYGSLIAESSSSCLSLLSESDLMDEPSTSGCSSEMASMAQSREKKRQKVKEFLKELKSMVPQTQGTKLGTLSTLDYVVSSMRKITEEQKQEKAHVFQPPSSLPTLQPSDSVDFRNVNDGIILNTKSELTVAVSLKNHVVLHTSAALMDLLGYPHVWWKGRLLKDFLHKKDAMTVSSYINSEFSDTESTADSSSPAKGPAKRKNEGQKQFFYTRLRRFRSLSSGFSIQNAASYTFFKVMVTSKPPDNALETSSDEKTNKRCMVLYFAPMTSPYKDGNSQLIQSNVLSVCDIHCSAHTPILMPTPERPNLFEELPDDRKMVDNMTSEVAQKLIVRITEVLKKPVNLSHVELLPPASTDPSINAPGTQNATAGSSARDDLGGPKTTNREKAKNESSTSPTSPSDISSSIMDEKSISSLYNQLNYSLNIKKFLLSHPKCFPVSDEDSSTDVVINKDDSEEEINEEEEMAVEFPVVRPPSCGSSTQVHVSEQGFREEIPSPPSFSEDPHLTREAVDNQLALTEESLRKHTKAQERLYLQKASKEQPHLFHMCPRRKAMRVRQKRTRPCTHEETDIFKFARNSLGQRGSNLNSGSGGGLFMSNVPMTTVDIKPTNSPHVTNPLHQQSPSMVGMMPGHYQSGMGMVPQLTMLPLDPATGMHLQPTIPQFLPPPSSSMQWPYYPQSGYSLLPQVMAGFYQPLLQPVSMTPVSQPPSYNTNSPCTTSPGFTISPERAQQTTPVSVSPFISSFPSQRQAATGVPHESERLGASWFTLQSHGPSLWGTKDYFRKTCSQKPSISKDQPKNGTDSENPTSSMEETSSSTQYLLEAISANYSSPNEETEEKIAQYQRQLNKRSRQRTVVPPWLQGLNWTAEVRFMYKMPITKKKNLLKKDREALKKLVQSDQSRQQLEELLEDIEMPDHAAAMDEEADYIFFPEEKEEPEDGERTPRVNLSPTVSWEIGAAEKDVVTADCCEKPMAMDVTDTVHKENKPIEEANDHDEGEKRMEESGIVLETVTEPLEKPRSPASQGSIRDKDGRSTSPVLPTIDSKGDAASMENNTKSPKHGSWSDEGSDNGSSNTAQKAAEIEDAQSSSSKVSSDLTPSEERSTEDAGSSLKESDMSTPKGSFASSNDKMSTDSGGESVPTPKVDFFDKLFVPLKVRMCQGGLVCSKNSLMSLPFWQLEAHMSKHVAMQYTMSPMELSTVLANDRRRLSDMTQPHIVNCQLLELLQETEAHRSGGSSGGDCAPHKGKPRGEIQLEEASTQFVKPPGRKQPKGVSTSAETQPPSKSKAGEDQSAVSSSLSQDTSSSERTKPKRGQTHPTVEKQLLEKLQSMTQGKQSELWPGDVIMSKVCLPVDLVGSHSMPETIAKSQDAEILDSVD